ncbi:hypothetical protein [Nonomuraea sp. NEAU-A123]|uniref:hypothetical protein n=1 Tax=Nonomuraea sp. NEAU-A123 TaxID=2839649 RepID=UPI001BE47658|nr:hypothetical protein [Nonomuraea sp. NEAU-A123]
MRVSSGHDATIRNGPAAIGQGYVIGNALTARPNRPGVAFDMVGPDVRGYRYGMIHGNFRLCAWLIVENVKAVGPVSTPNCPGGAAGRVLPVQKFMYRLPNGQPLRNCEPGTCSDGSSAAVQPAQCAQKFPGGVPVFGNVLPWRTAAAPHDLYATIKAASYEVRWRYVTRDGNWVMVRDTHADNSAARRNAGFRFQDSNWFFVPRACVVDSEGRLR